MHLINFLPSSLSLSNSIFFYLSVSTSFLDFNLQQITLCAPFLCWLHERFKQNEHFLVFNICFYTPLNIFFFSSRISPSLFHSLHHFACNFSVSSSQMRERKQQRGAFKLERFLHTLPSSSQAYNFDIFFYIIVIPTSPFVKWCINYFHLTHSLSTFNWCRRRRRLHLRERFSL